MVTSFLRSWLGNNKKRPTKRPATQLRHCLELEPLESRELLAVRVWVGGGGTGDPLTEDFRWSNPLNWQGFATPQDGDDVRFPVLAAGNNKPAPTGDFANNPPDFMWRASSIVDYSVNINNITIEDSGYRIITSFINPQTLTISGSITANIPTPTGLRVGYSSIDVPLLLTNNAQTISSIGTGIFEIAGNIGTSPTATGAVGLLKTGAGIFALSGDNTFTGAVQINQGTLITVSTSALGVGASGTSVASGATLALARSLDESVVIAGDGVGGRGALTTSREPFDIFSDSRTFFTNASLNGSVTLNPSASIGSISSGRLTVNGVISGAGNLSKVDFGEVVLPENFANTYQGVTFVQQGRLSINNPQSLGLDAAAGPASTADARGTVVSNFASLVVTADIAVNENLSLNGPGSAVDGNGNPLGALRLEAANGDWLAPITIRSAGTLPGDAATTSIGVILGGALTLTGDVRGMNNVTLRKDDQGVLIMPNAKTYRGNVSINNGMVIMRDALALGVSTPGGGGTVTVFSGPSQTGVGFTAGTLRVEGNYTVQKDLSLSGLGQNSAGALRIGTGSTVVWARPVTLASSTSIDTEAGSSLRVTGIVSGNTLASLDKSGNGTLFLTAGNSYQGATNLREGITAISSGSALGVAAAQGGGAVTVAEGATLRLDAAITVSTKSLTLSGAGVGGMGALATNATGTSSWTGLVNLLATGTAGEARINTIAGSVLTFPSVLSGTANLRKVGTGELLISGTTTNSFIQDTFVNEGTLTLSKSAGLSAIGGNVTVGDGMGGNNTALLRLGNNEQVPGGNVTVLADGLYNLNGFTETIGQLRLTGGEVVTGAGRLILDGDVIVSASPERSQITGNLSLGALTRTFTVASGGTDPLDLAITGVISGAPGAGIVKTGPGVMLITGTNTLTGPTTVNNGTLRLGSNNALPSSPLTVNGGVLDLNGFNLTVPQLSGTGAGEVAVRGGTFTFGGDNTTQTYAGQFTGTAAARVVKQGTGIAVLTGNTTTFVGQTTVARGEVRVNGSLSGAVTAQTGTVISGTGTLTGPITVAAGARVEPGAGPTTPAVLNVGNTTFTTGSTFVVDVSASASDQLASTGTVALNNATLQINILSLPLAGAVRSIVTGTSVTGTFRLANGTVLTENTTFVLAGRTYRINYTPTGVNLTFVQANATVTLVGAPNQNVTFTFRIIPANAADAPPGGLVDFTANGNPIGTGALAGGVASVTTQFTVTGPQTIVASFPGGGAFANLSATIVQPVTNETAVTASGGPSIKFGQSVQVSATVVSTTMGAPTPTGQVRFVNASTGRVLAIATLNGSGEATATVTPDSAGSLTIRAEYLGTSDFRAGSDLAKQIVFRQTLIATGAPVGSNGLVQVLDGETRQTQLSIAPFGANGAKVAVGDVNNDGFDDLILTAAGNNPNALVGVISGRDNSVLRVFNAFPGFGGSFNLAAGDVNGDGFADIIVGQAAGGDLIGVYSGATGGLLSVIRGAAGLPTGVTLAAGDIDGDGRAEVIAGTATQFFFAGAYNAAGQLVTSTPLSLATAYTRGVTVAAGDLNGDGDAEIVLGLAADPIFVTYDTQTATITGIFSAYAGPFGVSVTTTDSNGDGVAEILTAPLAGAPVLRRFNAAGAVVEEFAVAVPGATVASTPGL